MQFFHIFALHITPAQTNANKIMQVTTPALPISFAFAARGCFSTVTRTAGKSIDASKTPDVAFPHIIFISDIIHYPRINFNNSIWQIQNEALLYNSPSSLLLMGNNRLKQLVFIARADTPAFFCVGYNCLSAIEKECTGGLEEGKGKSPNFIQTF